MPRKGRLRFCVDKLDRQDGQGKLVVTAGAESFAVPRNKILSRVELCRLAGVEDELLDALLQLRVFSATSPTVLQHSSVLLLL